ncbi:MAG TPA: alpha/beta fold hydrolase [Chloroflexota bacterium]|jgi:pimeloyl-ACP methyl ester carboxylesterase
METDYSIQSGAPRVLIVPGLDGNVGLWRGVAATVLPGLRPLCFDHSMDRAVDGIAGLARRALAVLDADRDGDAPAYICGESFGGPIALTLARQHPKRVRGLVLISTFGRYPARAPVRLGLAAARVLGNRLSRHLLELSHPLTVPGALGLDAPTHVIRAYLRRPLGDVGAYRSKCELTLRFDARPWLHEIQKRAVVLAGVSDPVVPLVAAQHLARGLRGARFHAMPGGHLAWFVRPAEVGALVADWLRLN